jgi:ATP-binding cassette subfamily B protein
VEWARAALNLQRLVIALESIQFVSGFGLAIWLLLSHLGRHADTGAILLLVYWALNIPALGQEVAIVAWQYPSNRNITLRLLEPLGAIERSVAEASVTRREKLEIGLGLQFENVSIRAAGHTILREINLEIPPGQHVAGMAPVGGRPCVTGWQRAGRISPCEFAPRDRLGGPCGAHMESLARGESTVRMQRWHGGFD